jgi:hypothetical protein
MAEHAEVNDSATLWSMLLLEFSVTASLQAQCAAHSHRYMFCGKHIRVSDAVCAAAVNVEFGPCSAHCMHMHCCMLANLARRWQCQ